MEMCIIGYSEVDDFAQYTQAYGESFPPRIQQVAEDMEARGSF